MILKGIIDEDFLNYKKPSMYIAFPYCTFKCNKEFGAIICQNYSLKDDHPIVISAKNLVDRYMSNEITHAVVLSGLEPFDSFDDILEFVGELRLQTDDDVVIFTGYRNDEIEDKIEKLSKYKNIIVKFGRYLPNKDPHFDNVLCIQLISPNQYAVKIS